MKKLTIYLLPLICLALGLQAGPVDEPVVIVNEKDSNAVQDTTAIKITGNALTIDGEIYTRRDSVKIRVVNPKAGDPMVLIHQEDGDDKEITVEEMSKIDPKQIQSINVYKDSTARQKYGEKAANGVIQIILKDTKDFQ